MEAHGTHNGAKSVVHLLGTDKFPRIRVGVGKPKEEQELVDHVIGKISEDEREKIDEGIRKAVEAVNEIMKTDIDIAMNKYNGNC